jgi:hypothetical protein
MQPCLLFSRMAGFRIALVWWYLRDLNVLGCLGSWTKRCSRRHTARRAIHGTRPSSSATSSTIRDTRADTVLIIQFDSQGVSTSDGCASAYALLLHTPTILATGTKLFFRSGATRRCHPWLPRSAHCGGTAIKLVQLMETQFGKETCIVLGPQAGSTSLRSVGLEIGKGSQ